MVPASDGDEGGEGPGSSATLRGWGEEEPEATSVSNRIVGFAKAEATRTGGLIEGLAPMASSMAMKKGHVAGVTSP